MRHAYTSVGSHSTDQLALTPILSIGIFVGILTALTCITIAVIVALKLRSTHQQNRGGGSGGGKNTKSRPGNLPIKEKISVPLSQSEELYDEKNPDVIPSNEGKYPHRTQALRLFPLFLYLTDTPLTH